MPLFRRVLSRMREEILLLVLLAGLGLLLVIEPAGAVELPGLIHWETIGALAGLMVLSRGLEESGFIERAGGWLLGRVGSERMLAGILIVFSAVLAAVITNDVALFIVVPLTLGLGRAARVPVGRLVVFEALAVNAGSTASPVGNPQNLFLWQVSGTGFAEFALAMLPLGGALLLLLLMMVPLAFGSHPLEVTPGRVTVAPVRALLVLSLSLYPVFLLLVDGGRALPAAAAVIVLYLLLHPAVLRGVDWLLLLVFALMFAVLGLLARLPPVAAAAVAGIDHLPGGILTAGVLTSQLISNVPAAIFLDGLTADWHRLAWGVSVGGFGLAIGSLANLIALRLAREPGVWREFHRWSLPALLAGYLIALGLLAGGGQLLANG